MGESVAWFCGLLLVSLVTGFVGRLIALKSTRHKTLIGFFCFIFLATIVFLGKNPDLSIRMMPVELAVHLESAGTLPFAALLLALAWFGSTKLRTRIITATAAVVVVGCFINNSTWMVTKTPTYLLSHKIARAPVSQSTDYTCVPAACASALGQLGIPSNEAEMARYTRTAPRTGSTLLRAYAGLAARLDDTPVKPQIGRPTWDDIAGLQMPVLATLKFKPGQTHMVMILEANDHTLRIFDPIDGELNFPRDAYERHATGQMIWFDGPRPVHTMRADSIEVAVADDRAS